LILSIVLIIVVFSLVLACVWIWFFKNEVIFCEKLYSLGIKEFNQEQYKRAKTLFLKVLGMFPQYKDVKYKLALTYLKLKEYAKAKEYLEQCLADAPDDFEILSNLAKALQNLGEFEEAEKLFAKVLSEDDKNHSVYFELGLLMYKQKKFAEALEYFNKADELLPNEYIYIYYINKCKDEICSYENENQALDIINKYLELAAVPELSNELNVSLAVAYAKLGQMDVSEEYCKKSIAENPENIEAYKIRGLIKLVNKEFDDTKGLLKTALNLEPNNEELHNLLSYVLCYQADSCPLEECREKYFELVRKFLK